MKKLLIMQFFMLILFNETVFAISSSDSVKSIHGAKFNNSGKGSYYKWDDKESIRGLVFDAYKDFTLKSVKVYNQKGEESTRVFTLYDSKGNIIDSKSVYVKAGEQRITLNMQVPKGKGYKLMADIHKGLYKNDNVTGYPYKIGDVGAVTGSDLGRSYYYFFYDWEVSVDNSNSTSISNISKIYIPKLDFDSNDVYQNNQVIWVSDSKELKDAIQFVKPYTTILLKDGVYENVHVDFPAGIHHITIKGQGDNTIIKPLGYDEGSAFIFPNAISKDKQVHDISIVGLKVEGELGDWHHWKQFVKSSGGRWVENSQKGPQGEGRAYGPYNIYFYKVTFSNLFMGIYSHLYAHDWTVNKSKFIHSTFSHFWYMMGWHLAVINSTLIDPTHDALAIRGYYPEGEVHTYISEDMSRTNRCYGNKYVLDRGSKSVENGFLSSDDWTHIIANNKFKGSSSDRGDLEQQFIVFAYGIYDDDQPCDAEKTYMPPQNVQITGNTFDSSGGDSVISHAITIDAWQGVNNDSLASIDGIAIKNNTFYRKDRLEQFINLGDNHNKTTEEEIEKSEIKNNKIK